MSQAYARYDPATGRIHSKLNCHPSEFAANAALYPDLATVEGECDLDLDHVDIAADPPAVVPRPTLAGFDKLAIAADGIDEAVLELDRPFRITIDGETLEIDEPEAGGAYVIGLATTLPATWTVRVEAWPALPYETEVVAS